MSLESDVTAMLARARAAGHKLALAHAEQKNAALLALAKILRASRGAILEANALDLDRARSHGRAGAFLERLTLNQSRIEAMARSAEEVAALRDPVGEEIEARQRPNGLAIRKIRVPLGLIAIVYESRPNVTVDAAVLCLKSGNAVALRGGSDARSANSFLARSVAKALAEAGLDAECATFAENPDREAIQIPKRHP